MQILLQIFLTIKLCIHMRGEEQKYRQTKLNEN